MVANQARVSSLQRKRATFKNCATIELWIIYVTAWKSYWILWEKILHFCILCWNKHHVFLQSLTSFKRLIDRFQNEFYLRSKRGETFYESQRIDKLKILTWNYQKIVISSSNQTAGCLARRKHFL
jgi:hypothetical protein